MEHSINEVSNFLNTLKIQNATKIGIHNTNDDFDFENQSELKKHKVVLTLLDAARFVKTPLDFDDLNAIIIFGNDKTYMDAYVHEHLMESNERHVPIQKKKATWEDIEYEFSDFHFEFDFSHKHIAFIKSIIRNKSISKRRVVFYLRNIDEVYKSDQSALTRLFEQYWQVRFIMSARSLSNVHENLFSHGVFINIAFDVDKLYEFVDKSAVCQSDFKTRYFEKHGQNIISIVLNKDQSELTIENYIKECINGLKKERSQLNLIMKVREMCYRLYHMNVPLHYICKFVLFMFKDFKRYVDLVMLCAESEHASLQITKGILIYENFFLKLIKLLKEKDSKVKK